MTMAMIIENMAMIMCSNGNKNKNNEIEECCPQGGLGTDSKHSSKEGGGG